MWPGTHPGGGIPGPDSEFLPFRPYDQGVSRPVQPSPITLSLVNDHEIVLRGLYAMLAPFEDRVRIIEFDSNLMPLRPVDIALYDTYAMGFLDAERLERIVRNPKVDRVVVYSWSITPPMLGTARAAGVKGVLSKRLTAAELVDALERIHAGEEVFSPVDDPLVDLVSYDTDPRYVPEDVAETLGDTDPRYDAEAGSETAADWPGRTEGLTARQSEVVALIRKGMTNEEIAEATYLSVNTVKSYIRAAYRTMGVTSRTQAILWGIDHGFDQDRGRLTPHRA